MKVRYIKEGFFKTPEQMKATREKEKQLSSNEVIANTFNTVVAKKIQYTISTIVNTNHVNPFVLSNFTQGKYSYGVRLEKRDVKCTIENDNDKNIIHVVLDLGRFFSANSKTNNNPCDDINIENSLARFDTAYEALFQFRNKEDIEWDFVRRIKAGVKKMFSGDTNNKAISEFILNSEIRLDKIKMYSDPNPGISELIFRLPSQNYSDYSDSSKVSNLTTYYSINDYEKAVLHNIIDDAVKPINYFMDCVEFGVPVKFIIKTEKTYLDRRTELENTCFLNYKNFGDIENAMDEHFAKILDKYILTTLNIRGTRDPKYNSEKGDYLSDALQIIKDCKCLYMDYYTIYEVTYSKDEGIKIKNAIPADFSRIVIHDKNAFSAPSIRISFMMVPRYNQRLYNSRGISYSDTVTVDVGALSDFPYICDDVSPQRFPKGSQISNAIDDLCNTLSNMIVDECNNQN